MLAELTESCKETIKSAARKLTGFRRRQFQAEMAIKYCQGNPRRAEQVFGWGRDAVNTGLNELRTGIRCVDDFSTRGRPKTEEQQPELVRDPRAGRTQEPSRSEVPNAAGLYADDRQGGARAIGGQRGRGESARAGRTHRVRHLEPLGLSAAAGPQDQASKKIPETDAIFDHLRQVHTQAAATRKRSASRSTPRPR